jgi:hypothetical protein
MDSKLTCYYQNVRGLRTKLSTFRRGLLLNNYDIISLSETWLTNDFNNCELFDSRYLVWRRNREYDTTGQSKGGGVLLAVNKNLVVSSRPNWNSSAEDMWVTISLGKNKYHICVIYLCNQEMGYNFGQQLINFLIKLRDIIIMNPLDTFLVMGDFNMSSIQWTLNPDSGTGSLRAVDVTGINECNLVDELSLVGLRQYNHISNQFGRILDLILSNNFVFVYNITDP